MRIGLRLGSFLRCHIWAYRQLGIRSYSATYRTVKVYISIDAKCRTYLVIGACYTISKTGLICRGKLDCGRGSFRTQHKLELFRRHLYIHLYTQSAIHLGHFELVLAF